VRFEDAAGKARTVKAAKAPAGPSATMVKNSVNGDGQPPCCCKASCMRSCPCRAAPGVICGEECTCGKAKCKCGVSELRTAGVDLLPNETALDPQLWRKGQQPDDFVDYSKAKSIGFQLTDLEGNGGSTYGQSEVTQEAHTPSLLEGLDSATPHWRQQLPGSLTQMQHCKIDGPVPGYIVDLTGITKELLELRGADKAKFAATIVHQLKDTNDYLRSQGAEFFFIGGHNYLVYDFPMLYQTLAAAGLDAYQTLKDAGVDGIIDTLRVSRAVDWVTPPTRPGAAANAKPSHALGSLYQHAEVRPSQSPAKGRLHDALVDIVVNKTVLESGSPTAGFTRHLVQNKAVTVVSLEQATQRWRVLRTNHARAVAAEIASGGGTATGPRPATEEEIRNIVQLFASRARIGTSMVVSCDELHPRSEKQADKFRQIMHNEAGLLGIDHLTLPVPDCGTYKSLRLTLR